MRDRLKRGYEPEMELLRYFCDKELNTIDIGANYGIYSLKLTSLSKFVYSFEPIPFLYKNLKNAFKKIHNIKIYPYGISNSDTVSTLYSPVYAHAWSTLEINNSELVRISATEKIIEYPVEIKKLDSFDFKDISFIKIDVEGHELNLIEGAANTIKTNKPVLQIEIEERHSVGSVSSVIDLIKKISSYETFYLSNGKLVHLNKFDAEKHQNPNNNAQYIYDFIFIDRESAVFELLKSKAIII
jgi:FkbM family methyltransferase